MITLKLLGLSLILACAMAQTMTYKMYYVKRTTTAVNEAVTVTTPTSGPREVIFEFLNTYSATACTWRLEMGGTAPTGTLATVQSLNTKAPQPKVVIYVNSDSTGGTTASPPITVPAAQTYPIVKGGLGLTAASAQRFTWRSTCPIGTEYQLAVSEQ